MWSTEINTLKDRFAEMWLRKGDPWLAAQAVLGTQNIGYTSQCASQWPFDDYVKAKRQELLDEHGEEYFLPTKADLARKVWNEAINERVTPQDRNRNARLYAEIMGFVEKPDAKGGKNGIVTIRVNDDDSKL